MVVIRYFIHILLWEEAVKPLLPKQVILVDQVAVAQVVVPAGQELPDKEMQAAAQPAVISQVVAVVALAQLVAQQPLLEVMAALG
jgi:hypothetical protein